MFEQVLNEVTSEYQDRIQMYKVNIEDEPGIAQQLGARSIAYMVMISKSGVRESHVGALDKNTLKYYLDGLLQKK